MWVWDEKEKKCNKIIEIEGKNIDFYYITESIDRFIVEFEENRYLAELRDALLPDLMTGKIEL